MNLPNEIVNNINNYSMDEKDECENCQEWRDNQFLIKCLLRIKGRHNRNVEDDISIFLTVNKKYHLTIMLSSFLKSVRKI